MLKNKKFFNSRLIIGGKKGFCPHLNYWGAHARAPPESMPSTHRLTTIKSIRNILVLKLDFFLLGDVGSFVTSYLLLGGAKLQLNASTGGG